MEGNGEVKLTRKSFTVLRMKKTFNNLNFKYFLTWLDGHFPFAVALFLSLSAFPTARPIALLAPTHCPAAGWEGRVLPARRAADSESGKDAIRLVSLPNCCLSPLTALLIALVMLTAAQLCQRCFCFCCLTLLPRRAGKCQQCAAPLLVSSFPFSSL